MPIPLIRLGFVVALALVSASLAVLRNTDVEQKKDDEKKK
jgi:hypothetical protein